MDLKLLLQPFKTLHLPPSGTFNNQTFIVTGANTGLGLATASHLLSLGASKLILAVRSLTKGAAAAQKITSTTTRPPSTYTLEVWSLDLSNFYSVKTFAARASTLPRLDGAIMNAGLASGLFVLSPHDFETTVQVNVLSTSLLALLLLPALARTKRTFPASTPHLVLLGSETHEHAIFPERNAPHILRALNDEVLWKKGQDKSPVERYAVSKLLTYYVTAELASLVMGKGEPEVVVDVVTPGFCKSELMTREPGVPVLMKVVQTLVGRTTEEGAKTIVDAAVRPPSDHGKYLVDQKVAAPGSMVTSPEGLSTSKKVWAEILHILSSVAPEVKAIAEGKF